ncbi:hypothetical protein ACWEPN_05055 [Nonomuraea wenchangensis]
MFNVYLRLVADDGDPESVTQALGIAVDYHFGTDEVRRRIDRRPTYTLDDRTSGQRHISSMAGPASGHQL